MVLWAALIVVPVGALRGEHIPPVRDSALLQSGLLHQSAPHGEERPLWNSREGLGLSPVVSRAQFHPDTLGALGSDAVGVRATTLQASEPRWALGREAQLGAPSLFPPMLQDPGSSFLQDAGSSTGSSNLQWAPGSAVQFAVTRQPMEPNAIFGQQPLVDQLLETAPNKWSALGHSSPAWPGPSASSLSVLPNSGSLLPVSEGEFAQLKEQLSLWRSATPLEEHDKMALALLALSSQKDENGHVSFLDEPIAKVIGRVPLLSAKFGLFFVALLAMLAVGRYCVQFGRNKAPDASMRVKHAAGCCRRAKRCLGFDGCILQFTEMQLHMPGLADESLFMTLQVGDGQAVATRPVEPAGPVRFDGFFSVRLRPSDGDCVFSIINREALRNGTIARIEVPAGEVLRLAHRAHGQYCRFHVTCLRTRTTQSAAYLAMRVADVTTLTGNDSTRAHASLDPNDIAYRCA
uniref:Uncharacterized protein n=1 Tax=Noctiluca scintillans TaxID=2966 RepID=A0A7S1AHD0_NOCSC|mmetsp:Transcript_46313/g.122978  ORF Transcript_46313/g.122978 Transcript_46313/m.122978 type:complete len:462 (+) Transcript_46313:64-1449(+)|eukprot:CAMPEP_0194544016 /NCGR_PEP_ID=MMETSP0253-20130528/86793_1 /TAXON_ID=2966 /ORGANISM="Noctiluca scintillans" /LENGTH=461 /DNA_ID=CAMNT_0039390837 /DNA_START=49 /DNA_END=1431 /DNA_ORIENTATION=+